MTELLAFTIYFAFLCKLIWGALVYHGITVPLVLTSLGMRRPQKIFRGTVFLPRSAFPLDYTTCDSCYFQIHELQYLCYAHVTFNIF